MICFTASHTKLLTNIVKFSNQALGDRLRPYKDLGRRHTNLEDSPEQQNQEVAPYKFLPTNPY